jgi:transcriptional regulator with XRE-family HTH domain
MTNQELLKMAKQKTGMSQGAIARTLGIRQPSLSQWNAGIAELSDDTYAKLAELAGIDPAEIVIEKHARKAGPVAAAVWAKAKAGLEALKKEKGQDCPIGDSENVGAVTQHVPAACRHKHQTRPREG